MFLYCLPNASAQHLQNVPGAEEPTDRAGRHSAALQLQSLAAESTPVAEHHPAVFER